MGTVVALLESGVLQGAKLMTSIETIDATSELLPCPFCGAMLDGDDSDTIYPTGTGWRWDMELQLRTYHSFREIPKEQWCFGVHCVSCGAEIHGDSLKEAVEKWNRRFPKQALADIEKRSN